LLPNLLAAAGRNAARGYGDVALFEVGPRYEGIAPKDQRLTAAALRAGRNAPRHWAAPPRPVDLFDAKADALALLTALGAPVENLQTTTDAPAWFHPGRSGVLRLGATVLASFGELHPRVLAALDVKGPAVAFETDIDRIPQPRAKTGRAGRC
jgi:Phenylalanyl-tRNA synthetase beta subunit